MPNHTKYGDLFGDSMPAEAHRPARYYFAHGQPVERWEAELLVTPEVLDITQKLAGDGSAVLAGGTGLYATYGGNIHKRDYDITVADLPLTANSTLASLGYAYVSGDYAQRYKKGNVTIDILSAKRVADASIHELTSLKSQLLQLSLPGDVMSKALEQIVRSEKLLLSNVLEYQMRANCFFNIELLGYGVDNAGAISVFDAGHILQDPNEIHSLDHAYKAGTLPHAPRYTVNTYSTRNTFTQLITATAGSEHPLMFTSDMIMWYLENYGRSMSKCAKNDASLPYSQSAYIDYTTIIDLVLKGDAPFKVSKDLLDKLQTRGFSSLESFVRANICRHFVQAFIYNPEKAIEFLFTEGDIVAPALMPSVALGEGDHRRTTRVSMLSLAEKAFPKKKVWARVPEFSSSHHLQTEKYVHLPQSVEQALAFLLVGLNAGDSVDELLAYWASIEGFKMNIDKTEIEKAMVAFKKL